MRKESRSQTRQQTQTKSAEVIATPRKQSRKASKSTPESTPSKDTKPVSKSKSSALSGSSLSPGRTREVKEASAPDVTSHDTAPSSAVTQQQHPDANVSSSTQDKVSSAKKEKTARKTPDKSALKSRRWVRGGPIEYSSPPSDHSNDKTANENVADKQKSSSDSHECTKAKFLSKKNIASAFDGSDKEAKQRFKDSDSVPVTSAGGKRKKNPAQQSLVAESKGLSKSKGTSRKNSKLSAAVKVEPEPTRTKRMARLNAEAIVRLIYKHEEPASKSAKFHDSSDSDVDTDSSEFSSEDESSHAAEKIKTKMSQSKEDLAGTSKDKEEDADGSRSKKREVHPAAKRSAGKSDKSPKSQPKVSSKSCTKKKSVEVVPSPSWPPPKRMASLNAQVCVYTYVPVNVIN